MNPPKIPFTLRPVYEVGCLVLGCVALIGGLILFLGSLNAKGVLGLVVGAFILSGGLSSILFAVLWGAQVKAMMARYTLTRAETVPVWVRDFTKVLVVPAGDPTHPNYGNFWSRLPCRVFPHTWEVLLETETEFGRWRRQVRRCQRCGSQVHQWIGISPPTRGRI